MENPVTNRPALISLGAAILTVLSFCIGFVPIPMTAIVCYPVSMFFGVVALVAGMVGLRQIKAGNGQGRTLALVGIWMGTLTMLMVLCMTAVTLITLPFLFKWANEGWKMVSP